MKRRSRRHRPKPEGFALIITVIVVALLTIMAVAFLSSSTTERATSRASINRTKADLAAKAAVDVAIARLVDNLSQYPDSATSWETINGNPATVLYYRDLTPEVAISSGTAAKTSVLPLLSGATAQLLAAKTSSFPALTNSNSFDLNHGRFSGDTQGLVGAPPGATSRPEFRGQWVDMTDSDGKVTSRYAYWMEDQSFKANVNLLGKTPRGSGTLGAAPAEIPLQGIMKALVGSSNADALADDVFGFRSNFRSSYFFEQRDLNQVPNRSTLGDDAKFITAIQSAALNLTRSGSKRVNLNKIVSNSADPVEVRKQLDRIIKPLTYHLPNFPQRFYRNGSDKNSLDVTDANGPSSPSHRTIYLNKIAANLRDYVDTDSQPTIVNSDLTINIGSTPAHSAPEGGVSATNPVIAIGKEKVPFIQEYMVRVKQTTFSSRLGTSATYKLEIDHYVEFWNPSNQDIALTDLGSNPFLRIANQFAWDANASAGGTDIPEDPARDFSVPLSAFKNSGGNPLIFPAGTATVLTTDPVALPTTFPGIDPSRLYRPPANTPADSFRVYQGITKKKSGSNLRINSIPRPTNSSTASDSETEIILGNDNGVLESFAAPSVYYITANVDDGTSNADSTRADVTKYYFRASSLKGNSSSAIDSEKGDPRTNNEQLSLTSSTTNDDQTIYKLEAWNSPTQVSNTTFTSLNTNYVDLALWPDYATNAGGTAQAPAVVANSQLTSIGQLGDCFDPARSIGATPTGSGNILFSRGGGRTLRVGQPDELWDGDTNSASREWPAWRLTDVFTTNDLLQLDGRININGVNRDNGAAFKAMLYGYNFRTSPDSDPTIASQALTDAQVDALIKQMQDRLTNQTPFDKTAGPFAERGELSEMPIFNSGTALTGQNMSSIYDRGREELFRRLAELITTRGSIFTVYSAGQSLIPTSGAATPIVTATTQMRVIFRIDPSWTSGTPSDPFDPSNNDRFKKPDKYAIKILYVGD